MKEQTERTTGELIQMLANATVTWYTCGGHGKAWSNECMAGEYRSTLEALGVEIPETRKLLDMGKFNGTGAK
jgi:hypothetical protein